MKQIMAMGMGSAILGYSLQKRMSFNKYVTTFKNFTD